MNVEVREFNVGVFGLVKELNVNFFGVKFIYLDLYKIVSEMIVNLRVYGVCLYFFF